LSASERDIETDAAWLTTLIDEAVHTMQIILLHVQSLDTIPGGDVVLAWLKLMKEFHFMEPVTPVSTLVFLLFIFSDAVFSHVKTLWSSDYLRRS
jgi:hypothetical protein